MASCSLTVVGASVPTEKIGTELGGLRELTRNRRANQNTGKGVRNFDLLLSSHYHLRRLLLKNHIID